MMFNIKDNFSELLKKLLTETITPSDCTRITKDFTDIFKKLSSNKKSNIQNILWHLLMESKKYNPLKIAHDCGSLKQIPQLEVTYLESLIEELENQPERATHKIIAMAKNELIKFQQPIHTKIASATLRNPELKLCKRGPSMSTSYEQIMLRMLGEVLFDDEDDNRYWF